MRDMKPIRYRTGAESIVASKAGEPFVKMSEGYGKVVKISKDSITIEYFKPIETILVVVSKKNLELTSILNTGLASKYYNITNGGVKDVSYKDKLSIGLSKDSTFKSFTNKDEIEKYLKILTDGKHTSLTKTYTIKPWSSKIEGGTALKHEMTTNLRLGDIVEPGMAVTYDSGFFTPDIFDKKRLVFMSGNFYNVAFMEKKGNYEDSLIVNANILEKTGSMKYKVISIVIDIYNSITNIKDENDKLSYGDKMMSILDSSLADDDGLSDRAKEILKDVSDNSPKADVNGVIDRIDVMYNCELDMMSSNVRLLADRSNKRFMSEQGTDGKVTSEYSISGNPLLENQIELKYYISYFSKTKVGDKFIIGSQLKNTIGKILSDITTLDRLKRIDYIFSNKSTFARIVNSAYIVGTTNLILERGTENAVNIYRRKQ